jgi:hypothetical protein
MKFAALVSVMLMAAVLPACSDKGVIEVDSAKAEAERKAAAEHFKNGKYASVQPLGAEKPKDKASEKKPETPQPKQ